MDLRAHSQNAAAIDCFEVRCAEQPSVTEAATQQQQPSSPPPPSTELVAFEADQYSTFESVYSRYLEHCADRRFTAAKNFAADTRITTHTLSLDSSTISITSVRPKFRIEIGRNFENLPFNSLMGVRAKQQF